MVLSPRLTTRQTQQLTMTPELRQAIQLLQMTALELRGFIDQEVESNPLLETEADEDTSAPVAKSDENPKTVDTQIDAPPPQDRTGSTRDELTNWTENLAREKTLREHLNEQVVLISQSPKEAALAAILVDELDDDGYLRTPLFDVSERIGASTADLELALSVVQSCDPTGIAARSLGECFELQLAEKDELTPHMQAFLSRIEMIADQANEGFWQEIGISADAYADLLRRIKLLNPAPGKAFDQGHIAYATPDVFVSRNNLGGWGVELNNSQLPTIHINSGLAKTVAAEGAKETDYITKCSRRADWLIRSIEQRSSTILRVAAEIVRVQEDFFSLGVAHLRPLIMRDVASKLDINESTVSRIANGKYLHCERGTFELKFFFMQAIKSASGNAQHSSISVQEKIRKMIDQEDPQKILSDDKIVKLLEVEGVDIARRTVSKYRENMKIPGSVERRRFKANLDKIRP